MDNEKYGIELELITNKFKQKIQEIKSAFKGVENKKINVNANTEFLKRDLEIASNQVEYLRDKLARLRTQQKGLFDWQKDSDKGRMLANEIQNVSLQLEKAGLKADKLADRLNKAENQGQKIIQTFTKSNNITKGLDRMTNKIRRFGLSLLSIRSIWSLVSRASSAYLAQDTELANRLQSVWAGLGALLAPIIESIVNILAKAVKYIAIFIKALTGVDLLARASAKSMKATAGSAKALNKALAGFDELNNLDTDAGGGTGGIGGLGGLEDVEINTEWAEKIKAFGEWVKTNGPTVTAILMGITGAIIALKLGMGGIIALGILLLVTGVLLAIKDIKKYLESPTWKNFGNIITDIGIALLGLSLIIGSIPVAIAGAIAVVLGLIIANWDKIKAFFQNGIDWLLSKVDWVKKYFGIVGETIYTALIQNMQTVLNWLDNTFTNIKKLFDGIITFIKGVFTGNWKQAWEGIKQIFSAIFNSIVNTAVTILNVIFNKAIQISSKTGETISNVFKAVVNKTLGAMESILNSPIRAVNRLISTINEVPGINLGRLSTFNLPRLDVGTNYVPEDQLAMIHKGEAVIPKKFNSREYFANNDETNALLERVIEAIDNIEINPYTTVKDVGKASLNYINSKSRQLGESVVV